MHTSRHSRQVLSKALRRITNLKLSQAFAWWRDQAQALRAAHAKADHIILRMQHQSLASAFYSWLDAVLGSQQTAAQQEQLVDAAAARNKFRLVGEIFEVRHTSNCCNRNMSLQHSQAAFSASPPASVMCCECNMQASAAIVWT